MTPDITTDHVNHISELVKMISALGPSGVLVVWCFFLQRRVTELEKKQDEHSQEYRQLTEKVTTVTTQAVEVMKDLKDVIEKR